MRNFSWHVMHAQGLHYLIIWASKHYLLELHKEIMEDTVWLDFRIFWGEDRALPLINVQCFLSKAGTGPRFPRLVVERPK